MVYNYETQIGIPMHQVKPNGQPGCNGNEAIITVLIHSIIW